MGGNDRYFSSRPALPPTPAPPGTPAQSANAGPAVDHGNDGYRNRKRPRGGTSFAWVSSDGVLNGRKTTIDGVDYWECIHCRDQTAPQRYKLSSGTSPCLKHLREQHRLEDEFTKRQKILEKGQTTLPETIRRGGEETKTNKGNGDANARASHLRNTGEFDYETHKQLLVCTSLF